MLHGEMLKSLSLRPGSAWHWWNCHLGDCHSCWAQCRGGHRALDIGYVPPWDSGKENWTFLVPTGQPRVCLTSEVLCSSTVTWFCFLAVQVLSPRSWMCLFVLSPVATSSWLPAFSRLLINLMQDGPSICVQTMPECWQNMNPPAWPLQVLSASTPRAGTCPSLHPLPAAVPTAG